MRRTSLVMAGVLGTLIVGLLGTAATVAEEQSLKIGDGADWQFVASTWKDNEAGGIVGSRSGDGDGLQGYSLAFHKPKSYADLEAEFTVCMPTGHADVGFIIRAQDPTHYYLIHFPQSGQGYRAQHFWAALSKADGSGYLRMLQLNLVRRVASNPFGMQHQAKVKVTGDRSGLAQRPSGDRLPRRNL